MGSEKQVGGLRWHFLDFARAIAVLLVMLEHLVFERLIGEGHWLTKLIDPGRIGVLIFFLVSGFVIPLSIEKTNRVPVFLAGRFFRLYPSYWITLLLHFILWKLDLNFSKMADFENPIHWIANFTMFQMFAGIPNICLVAWTLGFEWFIYAGACLLISRRERISPIRVMWLSTIGIALLSICIPLFLHKRIPAALPQCLITSAAGYGIYLYYSKVLSIEKLKLHLCVNLLLQLVGAYVNYAMYPKTDSVTLTVTAAVSSIVIAYIFFLLVYRARISSFPKTLCWIGTISYSLYLTHGLLLRPAKDWSNQMLGILVSFSMMLVVGAIGYYLVEIPAKNFGTRVRKRMESSE